MINYVLAKGPLSICLAASTWSSYTSGIVSSCDKNVDHCVQVVGVDTDNDYWIVRNSWGTDWGESGYIYLKTGQNTCYITYDPTYAAVELA
jgi:C1A family cysteine protease